MTYLFQASIGPVQTFIASARRTRDLWFGSWLLSELSRTAAQAIVDKGGKLIFPTLTDAPNIANKIVAEVNRSPKEVGDAVKKAVWERLNDLWREMRPRLGDLTNEEKAIAQILAMTECVWAAVPLDKDYAVARRRLDALMSARKSTHDFARVTWGSGQPKSSIDGRLESVIPEERYPPRRKRDRTPVEREADERMIAALFTDYGASLAEHLSAADLLKRNGQMGDQERFLSTSHVAALPFLVRFDGWRAGALPRLWSDYIKLLPARVREREQVAPEFARPSFFDRCDGALLYGERLADDIDDRDALRHAQQALKAFFDQVRRQVGPVRPAPYYAILLADGDGMGKIIDRVAAGGSDRHHVLSQALDVFAAKAGQIIRDHAGASIYVGGDDVLALLPLHGALESAKELAGAFLQPRLQAFTYTDNGKTVSPTLSAGLAVVHHLVPLSDALELARGAERAAKKVKDKNALAIIVSKRGGGDTTVRGHWGEIDKWLVQLSEWHHNGKIPDSAAYELRDLALRMEDALPADGLLKEALRILKRKRMAETALKELQAALERRMDMGVERPGRIITGFADELIVARVFADAADLAGLPLDTAKEAA